MSLENNKIIDQWGNYVERLILFYQYGTIYSIIAPEHTNIDHTSY